MLRQPIGIFATLEEVYPNLKSDQATLVDLLTILSRDDTLITCARINTFVSGPGTLTDKERQELALRFLRLPDEDIRRINDFARRYRGGGEVTIFFRGQLLELIRWVAKYCINRSEGGNTYAEPHVRRYFLQAALIAGQFWGRSTYSDRLTAQAETGNAARARALGPFRKAVEESNPAPHLGVTLGRGWSLFTEYFPRRYPDFATRFSDVTHMTVPEYYTCVAGLMSYTICNGPLFRIK